MDKKRKNQNLTTGAVGWLQKLVFRGPLWRAFSEEAQLLESSFSGVKQLRPMQKTYQKSGRVFFVVVFLWATKKWLKKDASSLVYQLYLAKMTINFYYANVG